MGFLNTTIVASGDDGFVSIVLFYISVISMEKRKDY